MMKVFELVERETSALLVCNRGLTGTSLTYVVLSEKKQESCFFKFNFRIEAVQVECFQDSRWIARVLRSILKI
jgi:hypothetical protein